MVALTLAKQDFVIVLRSKENAAAAVLTVDILVLEPARQRRIERDGGYGMSGGSRS